MLYIEDGGIIRLTRGDTPVLASWSGKAVTSGCGH